MAYLSDCLLKAQFLNNRAVPKPILLRRHASESGACEVQRCKMVHPHKGSSQAVSEDTQMGRCCQSNELASWCKEVRQI